MYPSTEQAKWIGVRIGLVAVVFAVGFVLLMVRAYQLQVTDARSLAKRAEKQRTRVIHLEARRGMILDRSGEQLASSLEVNSICAGPRRITRKKHTAEVLARILDMDEGEVLAKLSEDKAFVWIKRRISPLLAAQIRKAGLEGVFSVTEFRRFYPLKHFAAHILGFAGIDSKGLEGLELAYDKDLKAESVPLTVQRDARGRPVMFAAAEPSPKRRDLHLTLDRNIQYVVEKELDEAVRKEKARSGTAIVLDADTGQILALAVRPTYNLNVFQKVSAQVRRNRAVTDAFEPGSTFKVFLLASAFDLGRISDGQHFYCHKGLYRYKGAEIHDTVPHGTLTPDEILIYSSNIGAVKISEQLNRSEFYRILKRFGFGSRTGIDLPGESSGSLMRPGRWSALTKANVAFGQGITVNALQLTTAFAAAVNGGTLYRPMLMKRMTNAFGETVRESRPVAVRRVIKPETSARIVEMLRQVIVRGTGKAARIPGVFVIGKTGTAQKATHSGGYSKEKYVASFVGALLKIKPRLVIFVMLDEPGGKHKTGGKIAAPLFRRIAKGILALCGNKSDPTWPLLAASRGWSTQAGKKRNKRIKVHRGPKPGQWIVPNLSGHTMREILDLCGTMKCDVSFQGTGRAIDQKPRPGEIIKEGATLEVTFSGQAT
jgi:cell division protein FtsI (penicillin-binding protein 3)